MSQDKIELPSDLRCNLDGAIGGTYQLPDGREFWMDAAAVRAILGRIEPVMLSWLEAQGRVTSTEAPIQDEVERAIAGVLERHWTTLSASVHTAQFREMSSHFVKTAARKVLAALPSPPQESR
jgi:hypothetical protein